MITREQIITMLLMRNRQTPPTPFSHLPMELIHKIIDSYYDPNPESDISIALHHAAYAQQENVDILLAMLEHNPNLLRLEGNVKTPGGDEIRRVTIYEFLLGAGDYELAKLVQGFFEKITDGEQEKLRQYERYRPHIEGLLTQKPYNLMPLIELIKKATPKEITALLNKDMASDSELCKALIQFRKDWAPRILTKPCMHYNYASLKHAFELLVREWVNLYKASNDNYDKINLVWLQLGFEMRRLPGIDRCLVAQGLHYILDDGEDVARAYKFKHDVDAVDFPITDCDDSLDGLGGDFGVDIYYGGGARLGGGGRRLAGSSLDSLCRTKTSNLQSLCSHSEPINRSGM